MKDGRRPGYEMSRNGTVAGVDTSTGTSIIMDMGMDMDPARLALVRVSSCAVAARLASGLDPLALAVKGRVLLGAET